MKKFVFVALAVIAIVGFCLKSNPIETCPDPVQQVAMKFASHAEAKITAAQFTKSETSLTGKVVRHYYDVTFTQGSTSRTRRIVLPIDRGTVCAAKFIN